MYLKRKCGKVISDWLQSGTKQALLVKGARQVGKTRLIREVLKSEGADFFEINLIETPAAVKVLEQASSVDELAIGLST